MQRNNRKPCHQVEVEPDQLVQGILAFAGGPFGVGDLYLDRIGAEGLGKGRDEGGGLLATVDIDDDVAVIGPQHAAVIMHVHAGHLVGGNVDYARSQAPECGVLALLAYGADHVVPLLDLCHQARNLLGGVLQIGIQGDDDLAVRHLECRQNGHMLAEIAVKFYHLDTRVLINHAAQDLQ